MFPPLPPPSSRCAPRVPRWFAVAIMGGIGLVASGWLLFGACLVAVLMAGAKILDCVRYEREKREALAAVAE